MRIRWRGVARVAAIVVVGLVALRLVPTLLHAPEPPPLGRDVGLPKARPVAPVIETKTAHRHHRRHHHRKRIRPAPNRESAARAKISSAPRSAPKPVEPAPPPVPENVPPPAPEPAPEPVPATLPEPPPAPRSVPGDGSQEFAPH